MSERRARCLDLFFFFQAEDGIRDVAVTGVQTCALPIWAGPAILPQPLLAVGPSPVWSPRRGVARFVTRRAGRRAPRAYAGLGLLSSRADVKGRSPDRQDARERCPTRFPPAGAWEAQPARSPSGAPEARLAQRPAPAARAA